MRLDKTKGRRDCSLRIGVTSQNFRTITGHAGMTRRFLVYGCNGDGEWVEVERLDLPKEMSMHEFRGDEHPVDKLDILITANCGAGFINRLRNRGVEVVATSETSPLTAIKALIAGEPLPPAEPHEHDDDHHHHGHGHGQGQGMKVGLGPGMGRGQGRPGHDHDH